MANKGMPSMLALLGLLAVAGYQNRDKIGEALKGLQSRGGTDPNGGGQDSLSSILGGLGDLFGGGATGSKGSGGSNVLTGGLGDLMDNFRQSGQADTADSWVTMGVPTKGLSPSEVEQAVGRENLDELSKRTGLSYDELVKRLASAIPESVDRLTPGGNMPSSDTDIRDRLTGLA